MVITSRFYRDSQTQSFFQKKNFWGGKGKEWVRDFKEKEGEKLQVLGENIFNRLIINKKKQLANGQLLPYFLPLIL
ncbi:MAG TPA: hypothetical protein DHW64_05155 [Chitinophagaceae bacterium]|nr:hypothetical protein [Chitinophagaceae bacterium]